MRCDGRRCRRRRLGSRSFRGKPLPIAFSTAAPATTTSPAAPTAPATPLTPLTPLVTFTGAFGVLAARSPPCTPAPAAAGTISALRAFAALTPGGRIIVAGGLGRLDGSDPRRARHRRVDGPWTTLGAATEPGAPGWRVARHRCGVRRRGRRALGHRGLVLFLVIGPCPLVMSLRGRRLVEGGRFRRLFLTGLPQRLLQEAKRIPDE